MDGLGYLIGYMYRRGDRCDRGVACTPVPFVRARALVVSLWRCPEVIRWGFDARPGDDPGRPRPGAPVGPDVGRRARVLSLSSSTSQF